MTCASPDKTLFLGDRCAGGSGFRAELQELGAGADCAEHFFRKAVATAGLAQIMAVWLAGSCVIWEASYT